VDLGFFLSYAHADQQAVTRLRAFLQHYPLPVDEQGQTRRLVAFRDVEDLRAGRLDHELRATLHDTGALLVCCSPSAQDSAWVNKEVAWFLQGDSDRPLCAALLAGTRETAAPEPLEASLRAHEDADLYFADLTQGWFLGRPRSKTRLEILRLIAALADVDLKVLIDLDRRRVVRRRALSVGIAAVVLAVILLWPITTWEPVPRIDELTYPVVAAEVIDGALVVATRLRQNDVERSRNYVELYGLRGEDGPWSEWIDDVPYVPRRHLLPVEYLDGGVVSEALAALRMPPPRRIPAENSMLTWIARPDPDTYVALQRGVDEGATALSHEHYSGGSTVYVRREGRLLPPAHFDLYPEPLVLDGPRSISPSDGFAVAALPSGLWLGAPRRSDGRGNGGLWHLAPGDTVWQQVAGLINVNSIGSLPGDSARVLVAQSHRPLSPAAAENPHATRLLVLDAATYSLSDFVGPRFDETAEVEIAGIDAEHGLVIRVARTVYARQRRVLGARLRGYLGKGSGG